MSWFPCFSCPMGYILTSPWPSKSILTQCSLKYSYSSLILLSLLFSSWETCHHSKTRRTGRNHVEELLCWEVLMGVVRQFLTSSSVSEVASPGKQPAAGSLYCLFPPPLLSLWKLLRFLATKACNTSWSFWVLHLINPNINPWMQAEMELSGCS